MIWVHGREKENDISSLDDAGRPVCEAKGRFSLFFCCPFLTYSIELKSFMGHPHISYAFVSWFRLVCLDQVLSYCSV